MGEALHAALSPKLGTAKLFGLAAKMHGTHRFPRLCCFAPEAIGILLQLPIAKQDTPITDSWSAVTMAFDGIGAPAGGAAEAAGAATAAAAAAAATAAAAAAATAAATTTAAATASSRKTSV